MNKEKLEEMWQKRCQMYKEGTKLWKEGDELSKKSADLNAKILELNERANEMKERQFKEHPEMKSAGVGVMKLFDEASKIGAEADILKAEGSKKIAEGYKLHAEADLQWDEEIIKELGPEHSIDVAGMKCTLEDGTVFEAKHLE